MQGTFLIYRIFTLSILFCLWECCFSNVLRKWLCLYQTNHRGSITIQMYTVSHTYVFIYIYEMCEIPNSTSCLWPSPGCLPPPLQPCAGDCPRWADGCSPLSRSAPSKVHFFSFAFSVYVSCCLMSDKRLFVCSCLFGWSTDGSEGSWEARWQHPKPRCPLSRLSSEDNCKDLHLDSSFTGNGLSRQQVSITNPIKFTLVKTKRPGVIFVQ